MKALIAIVVGLLPIVAAGIFMAITTKPDDANIGGGILLVAGLAIAPFVGRWTYRRL